MSTVKAPMKGELSPVGSADAHLLPPVGSADAHLLPPVGSADAHLLPPVGRADCHLLPPRPREIGNHRLKFPISPWAHSLSLCPTRATNPTARAAGASPFRGDTVKRDQGSHKRGAVCEGD